MATRIWVSPALCGCELRIDAKWSGEAADDGKQYQHPASAPGVDKSGKSRNTVTSVEIISQCATHAGWETAVNWTPFATMTGYCDIPATPSPGLCLYVNHWRFTNLLHRLTLCDCTPNHVHSRADDSQVTVQHPHHTSRCQLHADDDNQHTKALDVERRRNQLQLAFDQLPSAVPFSAALDAAGKIVVDTSQLKSQDRKSVV